MEANGQKKIVDVTNFTDDILEIEQPQENKKVTVSSANDKFIISQNNVLAQTSFPISINPNGKYVIVTTPTGNRYLGVFPSEAIDNLTKTKVIDQLQESVPLQLTEGPAGELEYEVSGEKLVKIFNLFDIKAPISLTVSALDGQLLDIEQPTWYKVFGFLFNS